MRGKEESGTYPKMSDMIAALHGLRRVIAVHAYRYDTSGPYAYARYAWAPPFSGIIEPSSAKELHGTRLSVGLI